MESNFKNNNGGYKFNNNFQPQDAAAPSVAEAPKADFVKTGTKWVANKVNNLPKPAKNGLKAGLVVVGVVCTILVVDKVALKGKIKNYILGACGSGKKKKDSNNEETATEGAEFEETK